MQFRSLNFLRLVLKPHNAQCLSKRLLTYLLTPWSRVLLENQPVFNQSRNSSHSMELEGSLPHSKVPATCLYPEPARSVHTPTSHFLKIYFNIIFSIFSFTPGCTSGLFPLGFPTYVAPSTWATNLHTHKKTKDKTIVRKRLHVP